MAHTSGRRAVYIMLNRILEFIGMAAMFLGMCMCECDGTAFLIQLALVILGSLIAFPVTVTILFINGLPSVTA